MSEVNYGPNRHFLPRFLKALAATAVLSLGAQFNGSAKAVTEEVAISTPADVSGLQQAEREFGPIQVVPQETVTISPPEDPTIPDDVREELERENLTTLECSARALDEEINAIALASHCFKQASYDKPIPVFGGKYRNQNFVGEMTSVLINKEADLAIAVLSNRVSPAQAVEMYQASTSSIDELDRSLPVYMAGTTFDNGNNSTQIIKAMPVGASVTQNYPGTDFVYVYYAATNALNSSGNSGRMGGSSGGPVDQKKDGVIRHYGVNLGQMPRIPLFASLFIETPYSIDAAMKNTVVIDINAPMTRNFSMVIPSIQEMDVLPIG